MNARAIMCVCVTVWVRYRVYIRIKNKEKKKRATAAPHHENYDWSRLFIQLLENVLFSSFAFFLLPFVVVVIVVAPLRRSVCVRKRYIYIMVIVEEFSNDQGQWLCYCKSFFFRRVSFFFCLFCFPFVPIISGSERRSTREPYRHIKWLFPAKMTESINLFT